MKTYVFTYGTLMKGNINHYIMTNHNAKYICDGKIDGVTLYDYVSKFKDGYISKFPVAIEDSINENVLLGEIYEVDEKSMLAFDIFEGEGHLYSRKTVMVNNKYQCYVYIGIPKTWETVDSLVLCSQDKKYRQQQYSRTTNTVRL